MPWNDNKGGGGGWNPGGGGRGPWGSGPQNGGGRGQGPNIRPPDMDEVLRRAREWLKRNFPNQAPGSVIVIFGGAALLLLWLFTGFYIVQPAEQGVVLRFGAFVQTLSPGPHLRFPYPIETVYRPNVEEENQIEIGFRSEETGGATRSVDMLVESLMLTGDENVVDIDFVVVWKILSAKDYLFEVDDVENTIKAVAESSMREIIGRRPIDDALAEQRGEIQDQVRTLMQATLDEYRAGVTVLRVQLKAADPPAQVIDAFRDVQAARADQEKKQNQAQEYANTIVPQARGEAAKIEQGAQAYKQQVVTEAQGDAQRFISILDSYRGARNVTRQRMFLDTMQRVLGGTNKIIIETKSGVVQYLPLPELRRSTREAPASQGAPAGGN